jgi:hypothetical protein
MDGWFLAVSSEHKNYAIENRMSRKYHYFENRETFCKNYQMDTKFFETGIDSGAILQLPNIACKKCYAKWRREFHL